MSVFVSNDEIKIFNNFKIVWVRQYLLNIVLFGIKDHGPVNIWNDCKDQNNLYVGLENIFLIFDTAFVIQESTRAFQLGSRKHSLAFLPLTRFTFTSLLTKLKGLCSSVGLPNSDVPPNL